MLIFQGVGFPNHPYSSARNETFFSHFRVATSWVFDSGLPFSPQNKTTTTHYGIISKSQDSTMSKWCDCFQLAYTIGSMYGIFIYTFTVYHRNQPKVAKGM